jgi:cytochrome c556
MSRLAPLAVVTLALAGAAAAAAVQAAPPPSVMKSVVDPAANALFAVGGEVDPANGPDAAKVPAARWAEAGAAAAKLHAVSLRLQQPDQAKDQGPWLDFAKAMAKQSADASAAVEARDGAKLAQAANDLGDTCSGCHAKYKPKS